jgi:polyisoprenoid-binding protein YceI
MNRTLLALALVMPATAFAAEWTIDPMHTSTSFSVKHMMVSTVRGSFTKTTGTVTLDDKDVTKSVVNVEIDPSTIDTREPKRDGHLKSPDFFDVAKYPKISFHSTKVEKAGAGLKVTGDLTMHGQTHPVILTVDGPTAPTKSMQPGVMVRGFSATGKLSRKDWGLVWNKTLDAGGVAVGDDIGLQIDGELDGK